MLITLSQNASSAISELLKNAPKLREINQHVDEQMNQIINTDICVRIRLKCFGWGGPSFEVALDEQKSDDYIEVIDGNRIVVDNELIQSYGGFKVEYSESWFGEGFYIRALIGISAYWTST